MHFFKKKFRSTLSLTLKAITSSSTIRIPLNQQAILMPLIKQNLYSLVYIYIPLFFVLPSSFLVQQLEQNMEFRERHALASHSIRTLEGLGLVSRLTCYDSFSFFIYLVYLFYVILLADNDVCLFIKFSCERSEHLVYNNTSCEFVLI